LQFIFNCRGSSSDFFSYTQPHLFLLSIHSLKIIFSTNPPLSLSMKPSTLLIYQTPTLFLLHQTITLLLFHHWSLNPLFHSRPQPSLWWPSSGHGGGDAGDDFSHSTFSLTWFLPCSTLSRLHSPFLCSLSTNSTFSLFTFSLITLSTTVIMRLSSSFNPLSHELDDDNIGTSRSSNHRFQWW